MISYHPDGAGIALTSANHQDSSYRERKKKTRKLEPGKRVSNAPFERKKLVGWLVGCVCLCVCVSVFVCVFVCFRVCVCVYYVFLYVEKDHKLDQRVNVSIWALFFAATMQAAIHLGKNDRENLIAKNTNLRYAQDVVRHHAELDLRSES